jgi:hypothetical protein
VDFFARVASPVVADRMLQVEYLRRFAPDLAAVTWQQQGVDLFQYPSVDAHSLRRRAWRKLVRTVRGDRAIQRNWEVQLLGAANQAALRAHLLGRGRRLHDFAPADEIARLVDRFYARPDAASGYAVSMLLTFAVWLERQP